MRPPEQPRRGGERNQADTGREGGPRGEQDETAERAARFAELVHVQREAAGREADQRESGCRRPHEKTSRGFSFETFRSSSSACFSAFESFFGTVTRTRASRSPLPPPFSFGAPRPLRRSSL